MTQKDNDEKVQKLKDLIAESVERNHAFLTDILHELSHMNRQLAELTMEIRDSQPKTHGAILLELQNCGKKCLGCPHPRWFKWVNRNAMNSQAKTTFFAVKVDRPLLHARGKNFSEEAIELIREAMDIIAARSKVIDAEKRLSISLTAAKRRRGEDSEEH